MWKSGNQEKIGRKGLNAGAAACAVSRLRPRLCAWTAMIGRDWASRRSGTRSSSAIARSCACAKGIARRSRCGGARLARWTFFARSTNSVRKLVAIWRGDRPSAPARSRRSSRAWTVRASARFRRSTASPRSTLAFPCPVSNLCPIAWRIDEQVIRGEIDNRARGRFPGARGETSCLFLFLRAAGHRHEAHR